MGTWGVSSNELVGRLTDFLDDVEGDFDRNTLVDALKFMQGYGPTSDSTSKEDKVWRKLQEKLGENA